MGEWTTEGGSKDERKRTISFHKEIHHVPGVSSTRGAKHQTLHYVEEEGAVITSSTIMEDVPAADCFSVDDAIVVWELE